VRRGGARDAALLVEDFDELAYEEALWTLQWLAQRYGMSPHSAGRLALSAAAEHLRDHGHMLAFGCCKDNAGAPRRAEAA
jgi:hypothetical protein